MSICPLCDSVATIPLRVDLQPHPYVQCATCSLCYQPNMKPKVYEAHHEQRGDLMSDADKKVNDNLAKVILNKYNLLGEPTSNLKHLDIGTKYPYLGSRLQVNSDHRVKSFGIDGISLVGHFGKELGVKVLQTDFETPKDLWTFNEEVTAKDFESGTFDIITLVHCAEHFYNPVTAFAQVFDLARNNALIFVRCPDSETEGIERDFTQGHYDIHPVIWNLNSMKVLVSLLASIKCRLVLFETYAFSGQRDYWFKVVKG